MGSQLSRVVGGTPVKLPVLCMPRLPRMPEPRSKREASVALVSNASGSIRPWTGTHGHSLRLTLIQVPLLLLVLPQNADCSVHFFITMSLVTEDPFQDPSLGAANAPQPHAHVSPANVPDTLAVGRNASLTLGTDSLVVLGRLWSYGSDGRALTSPDEALLETKSANCCGISLAGSESFLKSRRLHTLR